MWCRRRLDIGWGDLAWAAARSLAPGGRSATAERLFSPAGEAIACLSVRSSFDLLLATLRLPPGSEILFSAITVPGMPRIAEAHGLIPVPVDLDPDTAAPDPTSLERALSPASRMLVIAHLFGGRCELAPLLDLLRDRDVLVVEDCAQIYSGPPDRLGYAGDPRTDVSLFSFGSIKTATALGGALAVVRSALLRDEMRRRQAEWPRQGRSQFGLRIAKHAVLKALSARTPYSVLVRLLRRGGRDHDPWVNRLAKGFPGPRFLQRIRRRTSRPLAALLGRRLHRFDPRRLAQRSDLGRRLLASLSAPPLVPAGSDPDHRYWVFPLLCPDPEGLRRTLLQHGFDSTQGDSLVAVPAPPNRPGLSPLRAQQLLGRLLLLPLYAEMPLAEIDRLGQIVFRELRSHARGDSPAKDGRVTAEDIFRDDREDF